MSDVALVQLDRARLALAECKTAMEAKQISDVAEAARVYLERTNASAETVNRATEIRILAERQMGAFLKDMPKAKGGDTFHRTSTTPRDGAVQTLAEIGIDDHQSARAQKLADIPEPEFRERIAVAKASGGKLSTARIIHEWSPRAKAAGEEADSESDNLWRLKSVWKKTSQKDKQRFMAWANKQTIK